eukprot:159684-Alexandrium_andersonii.AAC.1
MRERHQNVERGIILRGVAAVLRAPGGPGVPGGGRVRDLLAALGLPIACIQRVAVLDHDLLEVVAFALVCVVAVEA